MSSSPTIIDEDDPAYAGDPKNWLPNPHAGDILWLDFMEPLDLTAESLASQVEVEPGHLRRMIEGDAPVDGELDLRLARYFGMSEGFFLRLQNQYDLCAAKRRLNGALDRILPRAA